MATAQATIPARHEAGVPTGRHIRHGLSWKIASQGVMQGSRMLVALILARLLDPSAYGVVAMALVVTSFFNVFGDLGLGAALIQRPSLTEEQRSSAFWVTVAASVVLLLAGILLARPMAAFYRTPQVAPVIVALSFTAVLTALSAVQKALLTREMDFRSLEVRQMVATGIAAVVAIGLALSGAGVWAIVAQSVVFALVGTLLLWRAATWRPRLLVSRAAIRDLGGFGVHVTGTQMLFFFNRNIDTLLIGRVLGTAALGAYNIAYQLMMLPLNQVAGIVADVLLPAFARLQHDHAALRESWLRAVRLTAVLVAPMMIGMVVIAPLAVPVVLGDQWLAVIPVVQALAWVGLHQSLQRYNSGVLQAVDRTRPLLRFSIVSCVVSVVAFVAGLPWGITGVAVAYLIASLLVAPWYLIVTARAVGLPVRRFLAAPARPIAAALVMGAGVLALRLGLGTHGVAALAACVAAGALLYAVALRLLAPRIVAEIRALVRSRS